jgi:hypothetical protein
MSADKKIPEMTSYDEIVEFWETHSLADYWDETEPAEFEIDPNARRRYLVRPRTVTPRAEDGAITGVVNGKPGQSIFGAAFTSG